MIQTFNITLAGTVIALMCMNTATSTYWVTSPLNNVTFAPSTVFPKHKWAREWALAHTVAYYTISPHLLPLIDFRDQANLAGAPSPETSKE